MGEKEFGLGGLNASTGFDRAERLAARGKAPLEPRRGKLKNYTRTYAKLEKNPSVG